MEARKITIVSTSAQKKYVINSSAETLGELKRDLSANNIRYDNMTFMEGLTKTELKTDDSLLPRDVRRTNKQTGEETITNELLIMLTNTAKKIRSGAMSRTEAYAAIKANNLQDEVKAQFGKNFTQCTTNDLIKFVETHTKKEASAPKQTVVETKETVVETPVASAPKAEEKEVSAPCENCKKCTAKKALSKLANILYDNDTIDYDEYNEVIGILEDDEDSEERADENCNGCHKDSEDDMSSPYSDDEINDMLAGLK